MFVTSEQLRHVIAAMRSIDRDELVIAGWRPTDIEWSNFRDNPYQFYLRAPSGQRGIITDIINSRIARG
jgi:hypothetical protein